jgi:hypothetical protein
VSKKDATLTAYIYHEGEGKKGGNNVASLILKHLIDKGWTGNRHNKYAEELNIIMDNCAGQNKNRIVLRLAALLVELRWYGQVNLIFLVAGHTKNAADRLFNLLKKEYRKSNIYNMEQLMEKLNEHRLVKAIKVDQRDFYDIDAFLDSIYTSIPSGAIKQYQYFVSMWMKPGWLQGQSSSPLLGKGIIFDLRHLRKKQEDRKEIINAFKLNPFKNLRHLSPPGIRPIKQVEMFKKWRRFVPDEHMADLYKEPDKAAVKKVSDDQKESRSKRAVEKKAITNTPKTDTKRRPGHLQNVHGHL